MKIRLFSRLWPGFFFFFLIWACHNPKGTASHNLSAQEIDSYQKRGKKISSLAAQSLSQALKTAIREKGVPEAIEYCKIHALHLLDTVGESQQVILRRASLKARNPVDQATPEEKKILDSWKGITVEDARDAFQVKKLEDQTVLYARPIMLQAFCLNCHGQSPQEISPATAKALQAHYPDDQATGYRLGELRGMWSIRFYQVSPAQP